MNENENVLYTNCFQGSMIIISGVVAGSTTAQFSIDMFRNDSMLIVMRFNPQFEQKIVNRNAQRADMRFYEDDEERIGEFPFKRGRPFKIGIAITRESFHFYVNGRFFTYFNHRSSPNELAVVKCWAPSADTELTITSIEYDDGLKNLAKLTSLEASAISIE